MSALVPLKLDVLEAINSSGSLEWCGRVGQGPRHDELGLLVTPVVHHDGGGVGEGHIDLRVIGMKAYIQ